MNYTRFVSVAWFGMKYTIVFPPPVITATHMQPTHYTRHVSCAHSIHHKYYVLAYTVHICTCIHTQTQCAHAKHNAHTPHTYILTHSNTQPHTLHTHTIVHMHICLYTYRSRMARPPQRSPTETCSPRSFAPSLQRPSQTVPASPSWNVITGQKWPHCMKPEMSSPW